MIHRCSVYMCLSCLLVFICGHAHSQADDSLQATVERIISGGGEAGGDSACRMLRSGAIAEVFAIESTDVDFREGSRYVPHALCVTSWDKPDAESLHEALAAYEMRKAMATAKGEAFSESRPPSPRHEVSLTILSSRFDSPEAAVRDLEQTVERLGAGVSVEVRGQTRTTQVDFGDWIADVGDKAIWAPRASELSVAYDGLRFAVSVSGQESAENNQEKAIELTQWIVRALSEQ